MSPMTSGPAEGFNPRLPGGRRRRGRRSRFCRDCVSIHAFRGEGDGEERNLLDDLARFNPRLPGGRRPRAGEHQRHRYLFQSTPSGGKATGRSGGVFGSEKVSIHAFRGEGDAPPHGGVTQGGSFNPRLPGGRRPGRRNDATRGGAFQSTPSGGKATGIGIRWGRGEGVSIHALRGEGDGARPRLRCRRRGFNPRLPGGRRPKNRFHAFARCAFQSTPSGGKAT